jgi:hypothetical protein
MRAICSATVLGCLWAVGCTDSGEAGPLSPVGKAGGGGIEASAGGAESGVPGLDAAPTAEASTGNAVADGAGPGDSPGTEGAPLDDAAGEAGTTTGTIVPLYTYPSDASWNAIVGAKKAHPSVAVVAIVNPSSGPGNRVDPAYTSGIDRLVVGAVVPIGYVSTDYTKRGEQIVDDDIDRWLAYYPKIQGIFFDEQSNAPADVTFYRNVARYAKGKGLGLTVGNPGASVPAAYLDTVDVMLIYEDAGWPKLGGLTGFAAQRRRYGIIPYAAALDASLVAAAKVDVAYVYATSDTLPNPWDSLTPYFDSLLDVLAR